MSTVPDADAERQLAGCKALACGVAKGRFHDRVSSGGAGLGPAFGAILRGRPAGVIRPEILRFAAEMR
jgi:hypothetical protein